MKTRMFTENIPSNLVDLLNSLVSRRLDNVIRYSWCAEDEAIEEYELDKEDVFSLTAGPLLMYFEDGLVVGAASDPSINSIVMWVEKNEEGDSIAESIEGDGELFPINAKNQVGFWSRILGRSVAAVNIVRRKPNSAKMATLPNEVGLDVVMDDGSEFILSHGLHNNSDDFSVVRREQIARELLNQLDNL